MAPKFFETPDDTNLESSTDYIFNCSAHANPVANIQWLKDGEPITEDSDHNITEFNVTTNCAGKDHCKSSLTACES